jgi:hypothetical protein
MQSHWPNVKGLVVECRKGRSRRKETTIKAKETNKNEGNEHVLPIYEFTLNRNRDLGHVANPTPGDPNPTVKDDQQDCCIFQ